MGTQTASEDAMGETVTQPPTTVIASVVAKEHRAQRWMDPSHQIVRKMRPILSSCLPPWFVFVGFQLRGGFTISLPHVLPLVSRENHRGAPGSPLPSS